MTLPRKSPHFLVVRIAPTHPSVPRSTNVMKTPHQPQIPNLAHSSQTRPDAPEKASAHLRSTSLFPPQSPSNHRIPSKST